MLRQKFSGVGSMWGECGSVVGELLDVKEDRAGNVAFEVAGFGVNRRRDADGGQCGVEHDGRGILKLAGQPGWRDEGAHRDRLLCARVRMGTPGSWNLKIAMGALGNY